MRSTSIGCVDGRQQFERLLYRRRQTAQRPQAGLVCCQFCHVGQLAVHQQVGDFFKLAVRRQILDVVSAIVQVVAAVPNGAQRGLARGVPDSATDFFGLNAAGVAFTSSLIATLRRASS